MRSYVDRMPPKRNSASAASASDAPAMNQATIRQLVVDSIATALEAQDANIANADNTNRNPELREAPIARKWSYKEFISCQPFNFKGLEGVVRLIRWFEHTESVFSRSNYTEDCKVKFATEAYKLPWVEFKKLLIKKYCPRTDIQKMEDEFYHLTVKGNDLKTYVIRFQVLATLCPTMVSDSEKMMEAFIAQVMEQKSEEKRLEDIPVVREFPYVFLEDLPGLPLVRQVEFQIDLVPRAAQVARALYRLAPSEMHELSDQLQELADRGFIRPSTSP
uniref:Putative reverse transcriptase domain-containing protein n=1 Tax=Tanacetum cinerariifolium TaxID=118510 RepID=A0A6L2K1Z3_TANCI|nr:putative reverse transcriptase domain-containing protein [Tanacetum cinerariifolium]